ncbi:MAG: hypothetical protein A2176_14035 [Spirochaetes bacterium RBG_13_51_14]|nr:MAG: hypothetical protein A2176_14035 [Spirochaetes bacterium RBG_13_51_14]
MRKQHPLFHGSLSVLLLVFLFAGCGSMSKSAIKGDLEGVKKHLQKGENINQYDRWGWTPLMWAVYYNYFNVVKFMLENGADPNARTQSSYGSIGKDSTPLMIASYYGWGGMVRILLKHWADKSLVNSQEETALTIAEKYNFTEVIELLEKSPRYKSPSERGNMDSDNTFNQFIILNDGSRIVGKIISQTRTTVTIQTKYTTMTIEKDRISEMKYK